MQALWLEDRRLTVRDDLPAPEPPVGESLVKVIAAGICNTDLELVKGYYPFSGVPGHEFVGRVESGSERLVGQRVVGDINASCGSCHQCLSGRGNHCAHRSVLGIVGRFGAFAEYLTLPDDNLHVVPDEIATEEAVFTEPLAAALQIQEQVSITPDHRVLVVGAGKLGQLVAQTVALSGCELVVVSRDPRKLSILETLGIETSAAGEIKPASCDLAVECTGNPAGFAIARMALRPQGTLVLKSTYSGDMEIDMSSIVVDEIHMLGSRCGPFIPALQLLKNRRVQVGQLIDERYPLRDALLAFERASAGTLKVLIDIDER